MTDATTVKRKWDRIYQMRDTAIPVAAEVLTNNHFLLPTRGHAIDIAAGLGGNAWFLAKRNLPTTAVDISTVAMTQLQQQAQQHKLDICTIAADLTTLTLPLEHYNVIVVSRFLDRPLCHRLIEALAPNGLLMYQTFVRDKVATAKGPSDPRYNLERGELLQLFSSLRPLCYFDLGTLGDSAYGLRNQAMLVAIKDQNT